MTNLELRAKIAAEKRFARRTGEALSCLDRPNSDRRIIFAAILRDELEKRRPEMDRIQRKNARRSARGGVE